MRVEMDHRLVERVERLFDVVLLGDRQAGPVPKHLPDAEVLEIQAVPLAEALRPDLDMGGVRRLGHDRVRTAAGR